MIGLGGGRPKIRTFHIPSSSFAHLYVLAKSIGHQNRPHHALLAEVTALGLLRRKAELSGIGRSVGQKRASIQKKV